MIYHEEVIDRRTGELITVSKGDWISINELAEVYGVGSRKARCVLREMDFLGIEGANDHGRHRIQEWAVALGYGRRNTTKLGRKYPFDVISPEGRAWIEAGWSSALATVEAAYTGPEVARARAALEHFRFNLVRILLR